MRPFMEKAVLPLQRISSIRKNSLQTISWKSLLIYLLIFGTAVCHGNACKNRDKLPKVCDYIVVGAGAAGATVASRLSENPDYKVCLFEAGIRDTEGQFASSITIPRFYTTLVPGEYTWNTTTVPQIGLNYRTISNGMGKGLGGSTSHNAMVYYRGFKADYDYWAANGAHGWTYDDVLPFFLKSENMTIEELRNSPLHSTCGPFTISQDKTHFDTPLSNLWEHTAKEIGMPIGECNRKSPFGMCGVQHAIKNGKRESTATAFLHPVQGRRNLFIVTEALVEKILIADKENRAYGIRYRKHGRIYTIRAIKEIIVCGGTYESPKLLQLSGIGPKSLLQRLKIRPHKILPVGQVMQDHILFLIDLDVTTPISTRENFRDPATVGQYLFQGKGLLATDGTLWSIFLDIAKQKYNWPEFQIFVLDVLSEEFPSNEDKKFGVLGGRRNGSKKKSGTSLFTELLHPKSRGTVNIRSRDPQDIPFIDPKYHTNPSDMQTFIKAIRMVQKILRESPSMTQAGATLRLRDQESVNSCLVTTRQDTDEFWICIARHQAANGLHPVGTCPIGLKSDKWAVVDPELRVYGTKGLRVADASVMPEVTSANTMAPSIMIGERASDFILKDNQGRSQRY